LKEEMHMAKNWFNQTVDETISNLKTDIENGLSIEEVRKRQEEYGLYIESKYYNPIDY
jgi:hypothetical protein